MTEPQKNTLQSIKEFGVAASFFAIFLWAALSESVAVIPVTAALGFAGGVLAGAKRDKKYSWKNGLMWGVIGLVFGIIAYAAI